MSRVPVSALPTGAKLSRFIQALHRHPILTDDAVSETLARWPDSPAVGLCLRAVTEAGDTTTSGWGSQLAYYGVTTEFLQLVRERSAFEALKARMFPVPPRVAVPHESSTPAVAWLGEGAPVPVQSATMSSATADLCKLGLISVLTKELLDRSSPAAEAVIRRVLTAAAAKFTDSEFLDPTKAAVSGVVPGSVTNGGVQHVSTGSTEAAIRADIAAMIAGLQQWADPVFIMRRSTLALIAAKTTGLVTFGVGGPFIAGVPVYYTLANLSQVTLLDLSAIAVADDPEATVIDVSRDATIEMDSEPVAGESSPVTQITTLKSFFQNNLIGFKVIRQVAWKRVLSGSVVWMATGY